MDPESDQKRNFFQGWDLVGEYWPRRLLHIPTMTSIERSGVATFLDEERPRYNILSYTWGRWQITDNPSAPALPVKGTTWAIPPVKEEHFTVEAFQKVVSHLTADGCQWAWIDIACIDQEDEAVKAEEVGRQASIFKGAAHVFVWLSHLSTDTVVRAISELFADQEAIANATDNRFLVVTLKRVRDNFHDIFDDPWFTSLWTLQELNLRNEFDIISAQGDADIKAKLRLRMSDRVQWTGTMLLSISAQFFDDLSFLDDEELGGILPAYNHDTLRAINLAKTIRGLVQKYGVHQQMSLWRETTNPNVLYAAAKHRMTSRPEDRIYAIMQVYNIRVGKTVRVRENPGLTQLRAEFSRSLNSRCPILGQLFTHTRVAPGGDSWMITENCRVPEFLLQYEKPKPASTIRFQDGDVMGEGQCIPFNKLIQVVEDSIPTDPTEPTLFICLDSDALDSSSVRAIDRTAYHWKTEAWKPEAYALLSQHCNDELNVLHLGTIKHNGLGDVNSPEHVGLILRADHAHHRDAVVFYRRLGICTWNDPPVVAAVQGLSWIRGTWRLC